MLGWLWIFDSLFSVINWTLVHDILPGGGEVYPYKIVNFVLADHVHLIAPIDPFVVPQWLGQPKLAMTSVILAHAWRLLPFATVIMIAGLASIPTEVQDAAKVDGATGLKKIWYVTLPLQLPIATVAVLFGIVFTATDMAVVKVLTNGGPFNQTQMLTTWAFSTGIESSSLGAGAAVSLFMLPILAAVTILMLLFARRVEVS